MPKLRAAAGEAGVLSEWQEMLLLHGHDLLTGWQQSAERSTWLRTAEARAAWRRHRGLLVELWLRSWPRDLPVASLLYDTPRERAELLKLLQAQWGKFERRKIAPDKHDESKCEVNHDRYQ